MEGGKRIRSHFDEFDNEKSHSATKYVRFSDEVISDDSGVVRQLDDDYKSKHTLDSDEEDEAKYEELDVNQVEGQEDSGEEEFEGNTKIMAFNMKDDLEDGHFDTDGTFIFKKKEREIKDAWLDNIDWNYVKKNAGDRWHRANEGDNASLKVMGDNELKSVYTKIVSFLQPNENIERAIKRLGKVKGLSAAEDRKKRWAAKKAGKEYIDESSNSVKELTGLADSLVSKGEFEAYQYSFEKLNYLIRQMEHRAVDDLDMFSDAPSSSVEGLRNVGDKSNSGREDSVNSVKWEYKMSNDGDAEIIGPKTSAEMLDLQNEGKFVDGGWARKLGTQSFYNLRQMKFSQTQRQFIAKTIEMFKFSVRWGYVPFIIFLGIQHGADIVQPGVIPPPLTYMQVFYG
ncbi:unnamed protein product [Dracunculus medinensis]|uniref:Mitochondrial import receptor subunit TOM7 homolog n=1 Tax=Dracunculus medinensis TaxID=318479 RepID=A0A0N4U9V9_DRAME|nr:unnamed protein product [Dracunculus medinensis]